MLDRIMDNQVLLEAQLHVLLFTSILRRLPVVRAGDTGTISSSSLKCANNFISFLKASCIF